MDDAPATPDRVLGLPSPGPAASRVVGIVAAAAILLAAIAFSGPALLDLAAGDLAIFTDPPTTGPTDRDLPGSGGPSTSPGIEAAPTYSAESMRDVADAAQKTIGTGTVRFRRTRAWEGMLPHPEMCRGPVVEGEGEVDFVQRRTRTRGNETGGVESILTSDSVFVRTTIPTSASPWQSFGRHDLNASMTLRMATRAVGSLQGGDAVRPVTDLIELGASAGALEDRDLDGRAMHRFAVRLDDERYAARERHELEQAFEPTDPRAPADQLSDVARDFFGLDAPPGASPRTFAPLVTVWIDPEGLVRRIEHRFSFDGTGRSDLPPEAGRAVSAVDYPDLGAASPIELPPPSDVAPVNALDMGTLFQQFTELESQLLSPSDPAC